MTDEAKPREPREPREEQDHPDRPDLNAGEPAGAEDDEDAAFALVAVATVATPGSAGAPPLVQPLAQNPAAVYRASLDAGSRRTLRQALCTIAALVGVPQQWDVAGQDVTHLSCPWGALRRPGQRAP